ncbi:uncharacterized protein At4g18490-like [Durio zibethinus]|uniref:Uncharacterized protein At4g18490-like n=1 Tax=Durio zibethinus TaxID=66656 RepID=A0A6P5X8W2_DURZI|nr:uncharacterized protein At4g18490-like [Durio zibethinus]
MAAVENKFYLCCLQMAEPEKTSSSAVDSKAKEKRSVLDEEIGRDFLSSWKSMTVTQDDALDFSFETISKGKKKPFNFDKLDMDFNLDGDFEKLSSFKMDMPDLDFSSPSKQNAKAKEKSKEETNSRKKQVKRDRFSFSFDFNELDGFDFDSSPTKEEKTCKKSQDSEAVASESSEVPKIDRALEDDCITAKLPASKDGTNSKGETSKGGVEACNSVDDSCPSKAVPIQRLVPGNLVSAQGSRISPEKTGDSNAKETYKSSPLSERAVSSELYDQKFLKSSPMDSLIGKNSNQETVSYMQAEVCSQGRRINTSLAAEHNVCDQMITDEVSIHEKLHWKNSFALSESDRDDRKGAGGNILKERDDGRLAKGGIILKDISTASLSREIDHTEAKEDMQNPTPELPLVSSDSEPTVTDVTARKDKEAGAICSRFFRRSEETKSQLHQPSPTGKEVSSFSRKKIGDMHFCSSNKKREDTDGSEAQNGRKLVGYSKLSTQELTKGRPVLLLSEKNVGSSSDIRDGFDADAVQNGGSKLIGKSSVQDTAAAKGEPVLLKSEKNVSLQANPPNYAEKTTECGSQTSVNPKPQVPKIESIQNSKFLSEVLKIAKKAPGLSSYKSTRTIGPNKDKKSSKRETNSLRNLEQNKDTPGNTSKIVLPVGNAEKLTPKLPSLKRKTFEESKGDLLVLKPLKRLSQSISESRNFKESSESVADKEVQNQQIHMEDLTKDILCDHLTSGSEVPQEVNTAELEFPSVMETDGNVEKAEAYGKELEDICSMLKKKHEEAKEILVRAVVNNNNLLMLNLPIFKEKISFTFCTTISCHKTFRSNLHCTFLHDKKTFVWFRNLLNY